MHQPKSSAIPIAVSMERALLPPEPPFNGGLPEAGSPERYLRPSEVQAQLGISRTTLWRWHAERGLKVVTVGGVTRIRQSDLDAFLRKHEKDTHLAVPDLPTGGTIGQQTSSGTQHIPNKASLCRKVVAQANALTA